LTDSPHPVYIPLRRSGHVTTIGLVGNGRMGRKVREKMVKKKKVEEEMMRFSGRENGFSRG